MSVKKNFYSDNVSGAAPEILEAIVAANAGDSAPYGADPCTERLSERFAELFETEVEVYPVGTGTAANGLCASIVAAPYGAIYVSDAAHVHGSECGGRRVLVGGNARTVPLPVVDGKIAAADLARAVDEAARPLRRRAAPGGQPHPGHRGEHRVHAGRGEEHRRGRARSPPVGPHGRRPLRQCRRSARLHAGRGELEGGCRRPLLRRHQERGARRRGRRLLRPRRSPRPCATAAGAAATSSRRCASSPLSSRPSSPRTSGCGTPATPMPWPSGFARAWRRFPACGSGARPRSTSSSSPCRRPSGTGSWPRATASPGAARPARASSGSPAPSTRGKRTSTPWWRPPTGTPALEQGADRPAPAMR